MQIKTIDIVQDITKMREDAEHRYQELRSIIETLSDATGSDRASTVRKISLCLSLVTLTFPR